MARYAAIQQYVKDTLPKIPGWHLFEDGTRLLVKPVQWIADLTLRFVPVTKRLEWLLEIDRLRTLHPVILAVTLTWSLWRGLRTTPYGHIGTDTLIYPTLAAISYFNPFLGIISGVTFGVGDIAQKLVVNDINRTNFDAVNYHWALIGYTIAYSSLMVAGLLPGVTARVFQLVTRRTLQFIVGRFRAARAEGTRLEGRSGIARRLDEPDPAGKFPVSELIASMAGAALGGYGVMHLAPTLEYPAFYLRPQPDIGCHNLEVHDYLIGRSKAVAEGGAFGGPFFAIMLNPAQDPDSDGEPGTPQPEPARQSGEFADQAKAVAAPAGIQSSMDLSPGESAIAVRVMDAYHDRIFRPDGVFNAVSLDRLTKRLKDDYGLMLSRSQPARELLTKSYENALNWLATLPVRRAAFAQIVSPTSLIKTFANAAREALAKHGAEVAEAVLQQEEIEAALRIESMIVAEHSPLSKIESLANPSELISDSLESKGVLGSTGRLAPPWRDALETLASPSHWIHLFLDSAEKRWRANYCVGPRGLCAHIEDGGEHSVWFPVKAETIIDAAAQWMGWIQVPEPEPFSIDLSAAEFVAAASVIDAFRDAQLRALLGGEMASPDRFTEPQLASLVAQTLPRHDPRWLVGALAEYAPTAFAPEPDRLHSGLAELASRGWLLVGGPELRPREALLMLTRELVNQAPSISLVAGSPTSDPSALFALRSLTGFWTIRFSIPEKARVRLSRSGGMMLQGMMVNLLDSLVSEANEAPDQRPSIDHIEACASCGEQSEPGAHFCKKCGAPLGSFVAKCPVCLGNLRQAAKFCTRCGFRVVS
jgi:hypothetical protein